MSTREVEVKKLIPPELARRQELSIAAIQLHLTNLADLSDHATVQGDHRKQLKAAVELLREAVDNLGPVLEYVDPAAPKDELDTFLTDTQKLRALHLV